MQVATSPAAKAAPSLVIQLPYSSAKSNLDLNPPAPSPIHLEIPLPIPRAASFDLSTRRPLFIRRPIRQTPVGTRRDETDKMPGFDFSNYNRNAA
ncbi:hypothetical protein IMZ48_04735, partial [Candidatus Bathyarchaeota archaeon]|nr:hypothetical protein [Candidatus Bathyarchaeota archaeon]